MPLLGPRLHFSGVRKPVPVAVAVLMAVLMVMLMVLVAVLVAVLVVVEELLLPTREQPVPWLSLPPLEPHG